jgi:hypothetical protein
MSGRSGLASLLAVVSVLLFASGCTTRDLARLAAGDTSVITADKVEQVTRTAMGSVGSAPASVAPPPARPLTPAEERMRAQASDYKKTIAGGLLVGCLGGAGIGALIERDAKGALIGCGAGAVVGGAAGYYVAEKKKGYATREQQLDAMIADVKQDNAKVATMVADTREIATADRKRIDQIERDLKANKISRQEAQKQMADVDANRVFLAETVRDLQLRRDQWRDVRNKAGGNPQELAEMDKEIQQLERQIASMEAELNALNSRRATSVVG